MRLALLLLTMFMAGCASWDAIKGTAVDRVRAANDRALEDAEFIICEAATRGALRRRYGVDPDKWPDCTTTNIQGKFAPKPPDAGSPSN